MNKNVTFLVAVNFGHEIKVRKFKNYKDIFETLTSNQRWEKMFGRETSVFSITISPTLEKEVPNEPS